MQNSNDSDTNTTSSFSLPITRKTMNDECDTRKWHTHEWLSKNLPNDDDEMMMNETAAT
ncbi:unnamed protein product, partial [Rotaria magnacalcarata]